MKAPFWEQFQKYISIHAKDRTAQARIIICAAVETNYSERPVLLWHYMPSSRIISVWIFGEVTHEFKQKCKEECLALFQPSQYKHNWPAIKSISADATTAGVSALSMAWSLAVHGKIMTVRTRTIDPLRIYWFSVIASLRADIQYGTL
jgi:hypothetical protein